MQSSVDSLFARMRAIPVVFAALVCHAIAGVAMLALHICFPVGTLVTWIVLEGVLAAALAWVIGLPIWWLVINALFGPLVVWMNQFEIQSGWFLGAFVLLASLFWTTFRSRVPLYLSGKRAHDALAALLPRGARFLDLGCGFGGLLLALARNRQDGQFCGCEIAPLPALIATLRARGRANASIRRADFWKTDLRAFDVVYAFLSPVPMPELWLKARREMHPGALLISNTFVVPGVAPDKVIALHDYRDSALHIWRM